jgi:hypothetical protein
MILLSSFLFLVAFQFFYPYEICNTTYYMWVVLEPLSEFLGGTTNVFSNCVKSIMDLGRNWLPMKLFLTSLGLKTGEADLVHMGFCFQNIEKLYICVSKYHHIYSMNTYICLRYLCEVSVKIALYFELHEKKNL